MTSLRTQSKKFQAEMFFVRAPSTFWGDYFFVCGRMFVFCLVYRTPLIYLLALLRLRSNSEITDFQFHITSMDVKFYSSYNRETCGLKEYVRLLNESHKN